MCDKYQSKKVRLHVVQSLPLNNNKMMTVNNENSEDDVFLPYDTVALIFKNLLAKDLCNCAKVCTMWQEAAMSELSRREIVIKAVNMKDVFNNCVIDDFPNNMTIKPIFGLVFTTSNLRPRDCFAKHFPKTCISLVMNTFGCILNGTEYERAKELGICGYFPDSSGIETEIMIGFGKRRLIQLNKKMEVLNKVTLPNRMSSLEPMFLKAVKRLNGIKAMILLTSDSFKYEDKLSEMKVIKKHVSCLWGGVARKLTICTTNKEGISKAENVMWVALLIAGADVQSWSIVIEPHLTTKDELKERLLKTRKNVTFYKHTIGLMLACIQRGIGHWGEHNVESTMFKEVFPEVPLIGAFGNGEFGFNFDDTLPDRPAHRGYSTSFMIITYR